MSANRSKFTCHAVINGQLVIDTMTAVSQKQAWFYFGKTHGFNMYDFKVVEEQEISKQLSLF